VPVEGPLLRRDLTEKKLQQIQRGLLSSIPTGFESHGRSTREMDSTMDKLVQQHKPTRWLRETLSAKHTKQLGTLGGGNHFVELVYDEADRVWMMLHSGSRNIGNVTAQHYDSVAARQRGGNKESLAYLEVKSKEGQEYLTDMTWCQAYALENRQFMMQAFATVLKAETGRGTSWSKWSIFTTIIANVNSAGTSMRPADNGKRRSFGLRGREQPVQGVANLASFLGAWALVPIL